MDRWITVNMKNVYNVHHSDSFRSELLVKKPHVKFRLAMNEYDRKGETAPRAFIIAHLINMYVRCMYVWELRSAESYAHRNAQAMIATIALQWRTRLTSDDVIYVICERILTLFIRV